jgi:putative transposase
VLRRPVECAQYCSQAFVKRVAIYKAKKTKQSMSREGNCWDNAVAESFFATLKKEDIYGQAFKPKTAVLAQVFEYIECDWT